MDENPMMYPTAHSIFYSTPEGREKLLNVLIEELIALFLDEAYPDRPRTRKEKKEALAYTCRTFPAVSVQVIKQFLKECRYSILLTHRKLRRWICDGLPATVNWPGGDKTKDFVVRVRDKDQVSFGDPDRLPQLEYYQVDLSHIFIVELQLLFLHDEQKKMENDDSDGSEDESDDYEAGVKEASDSSASDKKDDNNEAGDNRGGDTMNPCRNEEIPMN